MIKFQTKIFKNIVIAWLEVGNNRFHIRYVFFFFWKLVPDKVIIYLYILLRFRRLLLLHF